MKLSRKAILYARNVYNDPAWNSPSLRGDKYPSGYTLLDDTGIVNVEANDTVLVNTVLHLGESASAHGCILEVVDE